jgi:outer membrane protein TolC
LAAYNQTVLEAIRETADALTRVAAREQELRHADALVVDANRLLGDVQRRRDAGLADERAVIQARIAVTIAAVRADDLRLAAVQSRVSVLVAIGGSALDPSTLSVPNAKVSP